MKKMICLMGFVVLTSCSHWGQSKCGNEGNMQCKMHKEKCAECCKDKKQCPMDKMAPAETETKK